MRKSDASSNPEGIWNPSNAYPRGTAAASSGASTPWSSATGAGQTIGLVEFENLSDVVNWLTYEGLPAQIDQLSQVDVNGGIPTPGANQDEVVIDIAATLGNAPGAQTVVYDAPFAGGASFEAVVKAMIDDRVTIISSSWAYCEDQTTLADAEGLTRCFRMPQWWESACSTAPGTAGARAWTAPQTRSQSLLIHSMPPLLEEVLRTPAHPSVQSLPGVSPRLAVESTSGTIGRITLGAKRTGKRSAGRSSR